MLVPTSLEESCSFIFKGLGNEVKKARDPGWGLGAAVAVHPRFQLASERGSGGPWEYRSMLSGRRWLEGFHYLSTDQKEGPTPSTPPLR